jgi:hypothetical protein
MLQILMDQLDRLQRVHLGERRGDDRQVGLGGMGQGVDGALDDQGSFGSRMSGSTMRYWELGVGMIDIFHPPYR